MHFKKKVTEALKAQLKRMESLLVVSAPPTLPTYIFHPGTGNGALGDSKSLTKASWSTSERLGTFTSYKYM